MAKSSGLNLAIGVFGVISIGLIGSIMYRLLSSDVSQETYDNMRKAAFGCPGDTQVLEEPWEETGWARYCIKDERKQGPAEFWYAGILSVRGQFVQNIRSGEWRYYDNEGKVTNRKQF